MRHRNILICPKSKKWFLFSLHSYCHVQDIFKRRPNFRNMPHLKNLESRLTVSVLEAVDVYLSEKTSFMVIGKYFFFQILFQFLGELLWKSPNHTRVRYKYSFLSSWILFKTNEVNSIFWLSLWVDCLGLNFESSRQIGVSKFCMYNLKWHKFKPEFRKIWESNLGSCDPKYDTFS